MFQFDKPPIGKHPYEKLHKYPGLRSEDIKVWESFIDKHPKHFKTCDYNVRVGDGMVVNPDWESNIKRMAIALSQLRIDVIGYTQLMPVLIELKPVGNCAAIGQLMVYSYHYVQKIGFAKPMGLLLICNHVHPGIVPDRKSVV